MRQAARAGILCLCVASVGFAPSARAQGTDSATPGEGADSKAAEPNVKTTTQVVVTASRTEEPVLEAPVAVSIVDEAQVETSPADNYADLLRGVPGLNVIQTSARDVNFRGRGAAGVAENAQLALLDGRSIYLDYYGIVVWDYLPTNLDEVKRVEVLRGPGSAVWGANALSGVINVQTKSPKELEGGYASLTVGERGTRAASLRWADVAGPVSYKLSTSYYEQDAWGRDNALPDGSPIPFGYTFTNDGTKQPRADLRLDWEPDSGRLLSFRAGFGATTGIFHSPIGPYGLEPGSNTGYGEIAYTAGALDAKVYWNRLRADAPNLLNGIPLTFNMDTYVADATSRSLLGEKHVLVYGGTIRYNRFDLTIAPNNNDRKEAGLFLEDLFSVTPRLTLNVGARVDWFDTLGTTFSPRTSLVFKTLEGHSARVSYNRAYRAPSLVDNFLDVPVPNAVFLSGPDELFFFPSVAVGSEDLQEVLIDAYEVGYTATLFARPDGPRGGASGAAGPLTIGLSAYVNFVRDSILFLPVEFYSASDPPPGWTRPREQVPPFAMIKTFSFRNVGKVRNRGIELSANGRIAEGVTLNASYTFQDTPRVSDDSPATPLNVNVPPKHMAALSGTYQGAVWSGSLGVTYTGSAFWSDVLDARFWGETPGYTLVNASLGYKVIPGTLEVVANATNLLDRRVKQHVFGDRIGRKATLELRLRF